MSAVVDARFAGGPLDVSTAPLDHAPETTAVRVDGPGVALVLFAHEAHALAEALMTAADEAAPTHEGEEP